MFFCVCVSLRWSASGAWLRCLLFSSMLRGVPTPWLLDRKCSRWRRRWLNRYEMTPDITYNPDYFKAKGWSLYWNPIGQTLQKPVFTLIFYKHPPTTHIFCCLSVGELRQEGHPVCSLCQNKHTTTSWVRRLRFTTTASRAVNQQGAGENWTWRPQPLTGEQLKVKRRFSVFGFWKKQVQEVVL